ncbi:hypothetical protein PENTCL1PPCAC_10001, partial [Pristionchus entomophagus]
RPYLSVRASAPVSQRSARPMPSLTPSACCSERIQESVRCVRMVPPNTGFDAQTAQSHRRRRLPPSLLPPPQPLHRRLPNPVQPP